MTKVDKKHLIAKMEDYKRFAHVLLAVSVFFFLNMLIPGNNLSSIQPIVMSITTIVFLVASFLFYLKVTELKKNIDNEKTF